MIAHEVRKPAEIAALRQTASGNRMWPDSCDIASNITSECSAYKANTFYMGSSDVASNKAALLQVLANESYKKGASLQVTNAEEPCLKVDLQAWTAICKTPWFKCVFKPIKVINATNLKGNMGPLFAMIKSGSLPNLNQLWLGGNQIDDAGMSAFVGAIASGSIANLKVLQLSRNNIDNDGMSAFAGAIANGSLGNLTHLYLGANQIGDDGMSAFAGAIASGSLGNLKELNLLHNQIGDAGMIEFSDAIASGSLLSLQTLYVDDGSVGTEHPQLKAACEARGISLP